MIYPVGTRIEGAVMYSAFPDAETLFLNTRGDHGRLGFLMLHVSMANLSTGFVVR